MTAEELTSWDYHFALIREDKELPKTEKGSTLEGWAKLRQILGEDWLKEAVATHHPLLHQFLNWAPWQRIRLAEFGDILSTLQPFETSESLKLRLLNPKSFSDAEAELWTVSALQKVSLPLTIAYPKGGKRPRTSIVQMGHQDVCIQATTITEADEEKRLRKTFDAFAYSFSFIQGVTVLGKLYKSLSSPRINELKREIYDSVEKVNADKQSRLISKEGIIDCFISTQDKPDEAKHWYNKMGLLGLWNGPSSNVDEIKRSKARIIEKTSQLGWKPRAIVIHDKSAALPFPRARPFEKDNVRS